MQAKASLTISMVFSAKNRRKKVSWWVEKVLVVGESSSSGNSSDSRFESVAGRKTNICVTLPTRQKLVGAHAQRTNEVANTDTTPSTTHFRRRQPLFWQTNAKTTTNYAKKYAIQICDVRFLPVCVCTALGVCA